MVLAGPGTGKTQILAFRIAEILATTDSGPSNILALTFTESGVAAMRERLVSLIGPTAYGVGIYTFHSYANRVINESGAEFYKSHSLDQIDDITQLQLIMDLVDNQESELLRPPRSPHFFVRSIMTALRHLKSEGVTPVHLADLCKESIQALQDDPDSISKAGKSKGNMKQSVLDKIAQFQRTLALSNLYESYETELTTRGLYDYEDMILFVLNSLRANPELKARYQEQFHYILVDEYQDTNNAQNQLVRLLGDYFENPNIFVVGDDKQSIYRFQGASTANLLDFKDWYPAAQFISLKENYRSGQPILNTADALIAHNTEQLTNVIEGIEATLHAQTESASLTFTPYESPDREALALVGQIKKLIDAGTDGSDIAIIYRQNSEADLYADLLTRQGIHFTLEAGNDVLKDRDVIHILHLLHLAQNPHDDSALFHYLHANYSGLPTADLVTMGRWCKQSRCSWWQTLEGDKPEIITDDTWEILKNLYAKIQDWYRHQTNHALGDTVEHVLLDSGFLPYILQQPDHIQRLHRIRVFFDDVKTLVENTFDARLTDLFNRVEIRKRYALPLVARPVVEGSESAVRLMTAHKSKGLEFQTVFIPNVTDERWGASRHANEIKLPDGIVSHHHTTEEQDLEEERRLFYVALTRAKQNVYISMAENSADGKRMLPSQFITEITDHLTTMPPQDVLPLVSFFSPVDTKFVTEESQEYLRRLVAEQSITPTGLNTYLQCPMEYMYRNVYAIPGVRDPDQAYGTAMHCALELWGNWSKTGKQEVSLSSILSVFGEALAKEGLAERDLNRYQKLGAEVLSAYYEKFADSWIPPLAVEYSFSPHHVLLGNKTPITGKLDKIQPIPGSKLVRVIDYKTGKVRSRNDIEGKTASSDGDYKRQLVFYAVLAEADPFFPFKVGETCIAFLDDDKKFACEVFEITQQEKEEVRQLIHHVYAEITQLHFEHTPHRRQYGKGESLCDLFRQN